MNEVYARIVDDAIAMAGAHESVGRLVNELASFTRIVAGSPRLAKALADSNVSGEAKRSFIADLTKGALDASTVDLLVEVSSQRLSAAALSSTLVDVTAEVTFAALEREGRLESLESALYDFGRIVRSDNDLRDALSNPTVDDTAKEALVSDLLAGKTEPAVVELLKVLIAIDHGRDVDEGADALSRQAAARRNLVVADVSTAIELEADQQRRLADALTQTIGRPVQPRFSVDPSIIGSVVVRVGDEIYDGSVRHRLDQARLAIAGQH